MPEIELKPCPFCGGRGRIMRAGNNAYVVRCKDCGAQTARSFIKDWHRNKYIAQGNAAEAWNRRADGWHKWPEEKPEREGAYIVTFPIGHNRYTYAAIYKDGKFKWKNEDTSINILAWCELPEPWEGE